MDARELFLNELHRYWRRNPLRAEFEGCTWDDKTFLRTAIIRFQQGDITAWTDFVGRLESRPKLAESALSHFEQVGLLYFDFENGVVMIGLLPLGTTPLNSEDSDALIACLWNPKACPTVPDELPKRVRVGRSQIMYIEFKGGSLTGSARIGRVTFSKSRKSIYYNQRRLLSFKAGYKANYFDVDDGSQFWISNCRADGQDTLYPGIVKIDDDVREEYWNVIRKRPELGETTSFRSEGKYSKRRPQ